MKAIRYLVIPVSAAMLPAIVYATNGMNLEGYGPVALGMGGASMAYDNGSAAVMNNPATIGLMPTGNRADLAVGFLGPDVMSHDHFSEENADSSANAFWMPALGWLQKQGDLAYGVGVFAQGGMGTEYKASSFLAYGSNEKVRSEVSVGRLVFTSAFNATSEFTIGGSVYYVWAGMDIKMAMSEASFMDLVGTQIGGTASGSLVDTFGNFILAGLGVNSARFDFSDGSAFTGEAKGTGFAGKIGATFKATPQLTIGASYHTKTKLSDLKSSDATVTMDVDATAFAMPASVPMELSGKIKLNDFQWPAFFGLGMAFSASDNLMLVADIKRIQWADVMKDFSMTFTADQSSSNDFSGAFGPGADLRGQSLDAVLFQKWKDQTVIALGGAYKVNNEATVRLGFNRASNPIPDKYLNPLFPAIVESHLTAGVGYAFNAISSVDFALSKAMEKTAENENVPPAGIESTMSQLSWQLMYSHKY